MGGDLVQVFGLVGAAPAHGAALDLDRDFLRFVGVVDHLVDVGLVQPQMDAVVVEHGVCGFGIQRLEQFFGLGGCLARAADPEHMATIGDLHAELEFYLAQVLIERAGQVGQSFVVDGGKGEVAVGNCSHGVRDGVDGRDIKAVGGRIVPPPQACAVWRAECWPAVMSSNDGLEI
ncbi:hypothetical protein D3C81_1174990 [compost metagenome]